MTAKPGIDEPGDSGITRVLIKDGRRSGCIVDISEALSIGKQSLNDHFVSSRSSKYNYRRIFKRVLDSWSHK